MNKLSDVLDPLSRKLAEIFCDAKEGLEKNFWGCNKNAGSKQSQNLELFLNKIHSQHESGHLVDGKIQLSSSQLGLCLDCEKGTIQPYPTAQFHPSL